MQRRREIAVDDEDELLALQEQFTASAAQGDTRPAAKVTRVSRRPAAATAASTPPAAEAAAQGPPVAACSEHGDTCTGRHEHAAPPGQQAAGLMAALQAAMQSIVGEVHEREVAPPAPPGPAAAAAPNPGSSAFPEATHRKLSKFALGRQRQRGSGADAAQQPPQPPATVPASMDDASRIDAENRHLLASMSPDQLAEAREEALQRLPPAAVEFLRRRGAQKAATAAAAPLAQDAASGGASEAPDPGQPAITAREARALQQPRRQQQQQQQRDLGGSLAGASGASLAGRLRFGVDGSVVGLRLAGAGSADVTPADVAERDPIRQQQGAGGYSVGEACLLARSSLPQQRVLALRLLCAVLARARPRPCGPPGGGPVPLPADVAAQLAQELQQAQTLSQPEQQLAGAQPQPAAPRPDWLAVWHHALHSADITPLLRRSLDDQHVAVAAAAAEALAALLGAAGPAGTAEEAAAEAADASPLTGLPAPPLRHLQRPTAGGAWVAAPASPDAQRRQGAEGDEQAGEEEEEPLDEKQLSKVDPLSGLLHMRLLERAVYLIATARAAPALDALLSILIRCCQAGKDVADQVADTPGMLAALKAVLDAPPPLGPDASGREAGAAAVPAEASTDATAAAFYAARPKALRLLRQLAAASKAAARRLLESGLVRFALEQLLRAAVAPLPQAATAGAAAAASMAALAGTLRQRGALAEALRLWRSMAQHGLFLAALDDAYPSLCHFFSPPAAAAAAAAAGQQAAAADLQEWCVAREVYATAAQLCWQAARGGPQDAQLSPQCAAALASGALSWLVSLPLEQLLRTCLLGASSSGSSSSGGSQAAGEAARPATLSAFPALAAANAGAAGSGGSQRAVLLGALAAALHYAGSYWSVQVWHTAADRAAALQQLASLGLLPAAGAGGSSAGRSAGGSVGAPVVLGLVSQLLEQAVASDATWHQQGSDCAPSSDHAAQAAAAVAAAELAVALARLAATFLPQRPAAAAAAALLAPLCTSSAAARFAGVAAAADATLCQPWDAARQAQLLPLARAATAGLQMAALLSKAEGRPMPAGAASTALVLLQLLPPGDERGALQLLALLLGPQLLDGAFEGAAMALQAAQGSAAAKLACDERGEAVGAAGGSAPALPPAAQLSPVLLAGYAAAWLGLVPEQSFEDERQAGSQAGGGERGIALEPPAGAALLRPQGSRLPLPPDWALAEVPLAPEEAGIAADAATAAGGALALMLGWEEQRLGSLGPSLDSRAGGAEATAPATAMAATEQRLRSAVLLLFGEPREAAPGVVPGASRAAGQAEEPPVWRDPLARWCLAALMERYTAAAAAEPSLSGGGHAGKGSCAWQQQEARQLAEQFAAASYGDWLFGAAVALLLRQGVPQDTQLEVLSTLADEQALHLLPPLRLLPGPPGSYLGGPRDGGGDGAGFGRACFGGPAAAGGGGVASRRQELDFYVKLLSEGALERCLAASSSSNEVSTCTSSAGSGQGNGSCFDACSVAVPLVLHRLACACFPGDNQRAIGHEAAAQPHQALLCGVLQRCAGSSSEAERLLGWLLRWDIHAAQPSDVIDSQRLAAIKVACAAAGMDAANLLQATVEA